MSVASSGFTDYDIDAERDLLEAKKLDDVKKQLEISRDPKSPDSTAQALDSALDRGHRPM